MKSSVAFTPEQARRKRLVDALGILARKRFASDAQWARASGVPAETLSRLRSRSTCDVRTLWALADGADCALVAVPNAAQAARDEPGRFDRARESSLLDLCASGTPHAAEWRAHGDGFFMGGLATLLAGARPFDRSQYLRLAESLHIGITTPEVFALWLARSPIQPSRFLPMLRVRLGQGHRHATP